MGSAGLEFFFPFSQSVVRLPLSSVWVFAILAVTAPASPGGGVVLLLRDRSFPGGARVRGKEPGASV